MKKTIVSLAILLSVVCLLSAQDKATVQTQAPAPFHPGGPIVFNLKLNEPLPKGAHFDLRISPVSTDEEISLGSGEAVGGTQTDFRIAGVLPDGALPGEWHISVIWLFLPGQWLDAQPNRAKRPSVQGRRQAVLDSNKGRGNRSPLASEDSHELKPF